MVDVDFDKLLEYSVELVDYDGVLPLLVRAVIMKQWTNNLNKKGLYKDIIKECAETKPTNYTEAVNELKVWCNQNPDYQDIII